MNITVILCTFNRSHLLATALDSVALSVLPGAVDWEVLVVDNNSTDQTHDVVKSFCQKYPGRFRYLFEPSRENRARSTPESERREVTHWPSSTTT